MHRIDADGVDACARKVLTRLAIDEAERRDRRARCSVLDLRYYGGPAVAETAAVPRISEGTVQSQSARGPSALKSVLEEPAREGRPTDRE
ncbi:hypothetical protein ACIGNX_01470 [Actinosynnema sp. NPDC053489]|uniref:hypothetical protein n=1 Tax=Actinosynnema sp. NPDC053489 TaxID=3363916 RepID=UPI0037CA1842